MTDRIRLLNFPAQETPRIEEIIHLAWQSRGGIQQTRQYDAAHEIKLKGYPWGHSMWGEEKCQSRGLVSGILGGMYEIGWILKASVDVSGKELDKGDD